MADAELPTTAEEEKPLPDGDIVTLGDKRVEIVSLDRYKGVKGRVDRIALVEGGLVRAFVYYANRRLFRAPKDPALLALARAQIGEPQQRFGIVIFHYSTDEKGELLDTSKLQGKIRMWGLTEKRFEEMTTLHKSFPLLDGGFAAPQFDLRIECKEEQFQNLVITPLPGAHWKTKQQWYDTIAKRAKAAHDKMSIVIGRHLERDELMTMLGATPTNVTGDTGNAADIDLSDVVEAADVVA